MDNASTSLTYFHISVSQGTSALHVKEKQVNIGKGHIKWKLDC